LFHQEHAILFLSTTILLKQKFIFLFKIFCSSNSKKEEQGRIEEEKKHAMLEKKKLDRACISNTNLIVVVVHEKP
jgi:hypothetical protein